MRVRSPITGCPLTSAPSATLSLLRRSVNAGRLDRLLETHQLRRLVRHLDADRGFPRDERLDADRRGQRQREVGLVAEDPAHRHADRRLQLVLRDRRTAVGADDARLDAEGLQGADDLVTCGTNFRGETLALAGDRVEQVGRRQHPHLLRLVVDAARRGRRRPPAPVRSPGRARRPGRRGNAFELAREAVLAEVLAGRLRLLGVEERRRRRSGAALGARTAASSDVPVSSVDGSDGGAGKTRARPSERRPRRSSAQPLALGGEPAAERPECRPGAEIGGQDHAEEGNDDRAPRPRPRRRARARRPSRSSARGRPRSRARSCRSARGARASRWRCPARREFPPATPGSCRGVRPSG